MNGTRPGTTTRGGAHHDQIQHSARPRTAGQRQQHRSRESADLQLVHLCFRIGRGHAPLGLRAQRQPDPRVPGEADRAAGAWHTRFRVRFRPGRHPRGAVDLPARRPHRRRQEHLRRHLLAVPRVFRTLGRHRRGSGHHRLQGARRGGVRRIRQGQCAWMSGQGRVLRSAHQPASASQQRDGHCRNRPPSWRDRHRRQHIRHPVSAAAARPRRRHRHPFRHQVSGRPFRSQRRPRGGQGR